MYVYTDIITKFALTCQSQLALQLDAPLVSRSLVPRLPPCFYLACGRKISAGKIKARGKPGNEARFHVSRLGRNISI